MKLTRRLYEAIRTWDDAAKPPRIADLERALHLSKRDRWALKGALRELQDRGAVRRLKGGRYTLESRDRGGPSVETRRGVYKHKAAGYGFVDTGKPGGGIFIPPGKNGSALDRDTVEVEVYPGRRGKGPEGRVRRVVQRNRELVTGTALRLASEWILEPDDPGLGLSIDLEDPRKDLDDLSVVAEIIRFPSSSEESPLARVKKVLGPPGHLDTESRKILYMGRHSRGVSRGGVGRGPAKVRDGSGSGELKRFGT